jgi:hypothetical protein
MEQPGHSQISLTMDTYLHVMPAMLQEAAKALKSALPDFSQRQFKAKREEDAGLGC